MPLTSAVATAAVAVVAACSLAACSSSGSGSGSIATRDTSIAPITSMASPTTTTGNQSAAAGAFCAKAKNMGQQIAALQAKASDPAGLKKLLRTQEGYLAELRATAPASLAPTLGDLQQLLHKGRSALANPAKPDLTKLQALATRLPQDIQKIEEYVRTHCAS